MSTRIAVHRFVMQEGSLCGEVSLVIPTKQQHRVVRDGVRLLELSNMYVDPRRRGRGWAGILVDTACSYADRNGIDLVLRVAPYGRKAGLDEEQLAMWYGRHGFVPWCELMVRRCGAKQR